jgi:hypothetical protein
VPDINYKCVKGMTKKVNNGDGPNDSGALSPIDMV